MTPREASREIWRFNLKMDRRGQQLARILTPIANLWSGKDSRNIKPYDLWPSHRLKPAELEKEQRAEIAEETFKEMGVESLKSKHR